MPPLLRENLLQVLDACRRHGVFHPRTDADALSVDRAHVDEALDHLRTGGFIEIADWFTDKGQGYRLTSAGQAALADPRRLDRPAVPQAPPIERSIRLGDDRWASVVESVTRPKPAIVTRILIALNFAVFVYNIVQVAGFGESVAEFLAGALLPRFGELRLAPILRQGEWWRLVSYMFQHAGLLHIGFNMYALYSLGPIMEGRLGWWRFLILYFGSGIIGGVTVLFFAPPIPLHGPFPAVLDPSTVGASGAIVGVLTSLAAWAWLLRRYLPRDFVQAHLRTVGINLFILILLGWYIKSVSNACHAGGAIAGVLLTVPLILLDPSAPLRQRLLGAFLLAAIVAATAAIVFLHVIPKAA
ncbi:MAG TPA: rhomboid family intramembrane serine protease [Gemmataceae bacterium]|jgi:rhomboid protease GluP|nr:rhomboid family intramembrane serine protease [Gemmataceae bacterium]